ncbi:hypothetical protein M2459_002713 [Parabacteroides sp. PF5-5]|uniref:hypothetical protein n=1 Tax=unclassified Parabacteroides TaxID=2649774 RepID=UPI002476F208|nr:MULTISPECIES: hypothetical protein [unclassified Parabacteroides]MDH6305926.1 hypothetical protein [Parabacteroides sp. PH5-39]MDH6316859.1 hypothetical protein [Parabacteroides sp. PF5-13]MDH6320638.1 hypothetical protein [Parabacteroides sp. PH5-13]MDH6324441.1 hypothetical protein [Parabacteroides sp. PH5-8]MDH6328044.1 hypothetical protein [Parabacteroides sp. PH5-41]
MKKNEIKIEPGIRYFSDFKNSPTLNKFRFQNGILAKEIAGCGATTFALENDEPTIICSPRNELLKNKHEQYPHTLMVVGGVFKPEIENYLKGNDCPKILTSFDSLYKVLDCVGNNPNYRVIVDEFQCVLSDSSFKSEVEMRMLADLKQFPNVTYLSATPILDKYLEQIDIFKDMDFYQMNWAEKEIINVLRERTPNPLAAAVDIVRNYQNGVYPFLIIDGKPVYSTECVIFLNSVNNIVNIIKQTGLLPDEVNIIVGNSEDNDKQIAKIGKGFKRGRIPLRGEEHKKYTLCTSTAYAGCDFYSTTASTFAISDCNRINTSIDIATELIQIAGRQRLDENPFRRYVQFIYNTNAGDVTDEEFFAELEQKTNLSIEEINSNNRETGALRQKRIKDNIKLQKINKYTESYTMYDESEKKFVFNDMAKISQIYNHDVQKHGYRNGVVIRKQLSESGFDVSINQQYQEYEESLKHLIQKETFEERMKYYCDYKAKGEFTFDALAISMEKQHPEVKHYYDLLGGKRIKALNYKESNLKKEINNNQLDGRVRYELHKRILLFPFEATIPEAKRILQEVYDTVGVKGTATATGWDKYSVGFQKTKDDINGKRVNIIRIQGIKGF